MPEAGPSGCCRADGPRKIRSPRRAEVNCDKRNGERGKDPGRPLKVFSRDSISTFRAELPAAGS